MNEQGHRLDIHPKFFWPVKVGKFFELETSLGLRETLYYPHGMNQNANSRDSDRDYRFYSRELLDLSVEAASNVYRVYTLDIGPVKKNPA